MGRMAAAIKAGLSLAVIQEPLDAIDRADAAVSSPLVKQAYCAHRASLYRDAGDFQLADVWATQFIARLPYAGSKPLIPLAVGVELRVFAVAAQILSRPSNGPSMIPAHSQDEALRLLETLVTKSLAINGDPEGPCVLPEASAAALLGSLAMAYHHMGHPDKAASALADARVRNPCQAIKGSTFKLPMSDDFLTPWRDFARGLVPRVSSIDPAPPESESPAADSHHSRVRP